MNKKMNKKFFGFVLTMLLTCVFVSSNSAFVYAYTEPYPVVTSLPWVDDSYKEGDIVCYHFTLTYDQVVSNLQELNAWIPKLETYKTPLTLDLFMAFTGLGGQLAAVSAVAYNAILSKDITYWKQVQMAYVSIYRHMGSIGYKRVTISEPYKTHRVDHQGLMLNYWNSIGIPNVPIEAYYYMYY